MQLTIRQLRRAKFKVRVIHTRHYETLHQYKLSGPIQRLSGKGGSTKIQITAPDMVSNAEGIALCSIDDNFNRKLGNSIALGRALARFESFSEVWKLLSEI